MPAPGAQRPGLNQDAIDNLSRKHAGYLGALAPENLSKARPKPAFDLTGTWFIDLRRSFNDFKFGPPYPEFLEAGQQAMKEAAEARKAGKPYRDSIDWKGEWKSTKRWMRADYSDISEVECLPNLNKDLPSTDTGK